MNLGIVGSEEAKFTSKTKAKAFEEIYKLFQEYRPALVVSGGCHLGGIDKWATEAAFVAGIPIQEFLPVDHQWSSGYKPRNVQIARTSDVVVCITLKELPDSYTGMRFPLCYHCGTSQHVKSGGCWTVKYARKIGKEGKVIVIS